MCNILTTVLIAPKLIVKISQHRKRLDGFPKVLYLHFSHADMRVQTESQDPHRLQLNFIEHHQGTIFCYTAPSVIKDPYSNFLRIFIV